SKATDRALAAYLAYVGRFPDPIEPAVETRWKIAGMYAASHDDVAYRGQLRQIVDIDRTAGGQRTARVRYLAAQSALVMAQDLYRAFAEVKLTQPFERSLKEKQKRMNGALEAFGALVDYEVGDVTAAATFYMAEIYGDFSRSMLDSERPGDLSAAERSEYEATLEGEAVPFEGKAIAPHAKNPELLSSGVYNAWIDKSLARLAELSPGRYAKPEASSGWVTAIDGYAYRAPLPPAPARPAPATEPAAPTQAAETAPEPASPESGEPVSPESAEPASPAPPAAPAEPEPAPAGQAPMAER